jgi:hypothetical protein
MVNNDSIAEQATPARALYCIAVYDNLVPHRLNDHARGTQPEHQMATWQGDLLDPLSYIARQVEFTGQPVDSLFWRCRRVEDRQEHIPRFFFPVWPEIGQRTGFFCRSR